MTETKDELIDAIREAGFELEDDLRQGKDLLGGEPQINKQRARFRELIEKYALIRHAELNKEEIEHLRAKLKGLLNTNGSAYLLQRPAKEMINEVFGDGL